MRRTRAGGDHTSMEELARLVPLHGAMGTLEDDRYRSYQGHVMSTKPKRR